MAYGRVLGECVFLWRGAGRGAEGKDLGDHKRSATGLEDVMAGLVLANRTRSEGKLRGSLARLPTGRDVLGAHLPTPPRQLTPTALEHSQHSDLSLKWTPCEIELNKILPAHSSGEPIFRLSCKAYPV